MYKNSAMRRCPNQPLHRFPNGVTHEGAQGDTCAPFVSPRACQVAQHPRTRQSRYTFRTFYTGAEKMRFVTFLVGIAVVIAALCVVAAFAGRASAASGIVGALQLEPMAACAGAPCLLGVSPGRTAWADAQVALAGPEVEADEKSIAVPLPARNGVTFYRSIDKISVGRVSLNVQRPEYTLTAGWIIERYGLPCGVSIYWRVGMLTLRYPKLMANVSIKNRLSLESPVRSVFYHDPAFDGGRELDPCRDNVTDTGMMHRFWRGFASLSAYWRRR